MMGWYGGGMSLGFLLMGVFWLILLGLIVWLVVRLMPGSGGRTTLSAGESPLEILARRPASGEMALASGQAQRAALLAPQRTCTSAQSPDLLQPLTPRSPRRGPRQPGPRPTTRARPASAGMCLHSTHVTQSHSGFPVTSSLR